MELIISRHFWAGAGAAAAEPAAVHVPEGPNQAKEDHGPEGPDQEGGGEGVELDANPDPEEMEEENPEDDCEVDVD